MKRLFLAVLICLWIVIEALSQNIPQVIKISKDIEVTKLSEHAYIHTSYADMPPWKRVPSNGMIFVNNGKGLLFDTPVNDTLTKDLVKWIEEKLEVEIIGFVPNHWHKDCMGGIRYLQRHGIDTYAYELTRKIAEENNLQVPRHSFQDSLVFQLGKERVISRFHGAAHSLDNIVTWIPSEKILFAGCMAKELESASLGNTADGDLKQYPITIKNVIDTYPDATIVIPGHGKYGGIDILQHTLELLKKKEASH